MLELAAALVAAPLTVALCLLFGWHVYLVVNNKTTIEHFEGVRSKMTRRETLERRGRDGVAGALAIPREDSSTDAAAHLGALGPDASLQPRRAREPSGDLGAEGAVLALAGV